MSDTFTKDALQEFNTLHRGNLTRKDIIPRLLTAPDMAGEILRIHRIGLPPHAAPPAGSPWTSTTPSRQGSGPWSPAFLATASPNGWMRSSSTSPRPATGILQSTALKTFRRHSTPPSSSRSTCGSHSDADLTNA